MSSRTDQAHADLNQVLDRVRTDEFEVVHPARWQHKPTGMHVETGYSYGEGVVRFYADGGRVETDRLTFRGSTDTEFEQFDQRLIAA